MEEITNACVCQHPPTSPFSDRREESGPFFVAASALSDRTASSAKLLGKKWAGHRPVRPATATVAQNAHMCRDTEFALVLQLSN